MVGWWSEIILQLIIIIDYNLSGKLCFSVIVQWNEVISYVTQFYECHSGPWPWHFHPTGLIYMVYWWLEITVKLKYKYSHLITQWNTDQLKNALFCYQFHCTEVIAEQFRLEVSLSTLEQIATDERWTHTGRQVIGPNPGESIYLRLDGIWFIKMLVNLLTVCSRTIEVGNSKLEALPLKWALRVRALLHKWFKHWISPKKPVFFGRDIVGR